VALRGFDRTINNAPKSMNRVGIFLNKSIKLSKEDGRSLNKDYSSDNSRSFKSNVMVNFSDIRPIVQPKLRVNNSRDRFEQEADQISEQIVSNSSFPTIEYEPSIKNTRTNSFEDKNRRGSPTDPSRTLLPSGQSTSQLADRDSHGESLDHLTLSSMEARLGFDFSNVRVHYNRGAAESARSINALAYTLGPDIFFGNGAYTPNTESGQRLLAHELVHVIQQDFMHDEIIQRDPDENPRQILETGWYKLIKGNKGDYFAPIYGAHTVLTINSKEITSEDLPEGSIARITHFDDGKYDLGYIQPPGEAASEVSVEELPRNDNKSKRIDEKAKTKKLLDEVRKTIPPAQAESSDLDQVGGGIEDIVKTENENTGEKRLDTATEQDAKTLISLHESWNFLDEQELGESLLQRALDSQQFALTQKTLDALGSTDRDDVTLEMMKKATDDNLMALATSPEGQRLLSRMYDELTSGSMSDEESGQANRILDIKMKSSKAEMPANAEDLKVFPNLSMRITSPDSAPLKVTRLENGKIRVSVSSLSGVQNLYGDLDIVKNGTIFTGIELDETELIVLKEYSTGDEPKVVPALYLLSVSNQNETKHAENTAEVAMTAASLGGGGAALSGLSKLSTAGKVLKVADTIAAGAGVVSTLVNEHRGWILKEYGKDGEWFLNQFELVNKVVMAYGITRLGAGAVQSLASRLMNWKKLVNARKAALTPEQANAIDRITNEADDLINDYRRAGKNVANDNAIPKVANDNAIPPSEPSAQQLARTGTDDLDATLQANRPDLRLVEGGKNEASVTKAVRGEPYDPRTIANELESRYPGKVSSSTIPKGNKKNVRLARGGHPKTRIPYDARGFPILDDLAVYDTRINRSIAGIKDAKAHMRAATEDLWKAIERGEIDRSLFDTEQLAAIKDGKDKIPGLTWHHHQDFSRMQLVSTEVHGMTGHVGGFHMWFR
jgi:hypothetical protein